MKTRVLLVGSEGQMGQEISSLIADSSGFEVSAKFDRKSENKSFDAIDPTTVDIVMDFSHASLFSETLRYCIKNQKPLVSGTTGISSQDHHQIAKLGEVASVLWSPNMSIGIALFKRLIGSLEAIAEGFDFQLEETHHRYKKDRPSGTAIYLQEAMKAALKKDLPPPIAIRGGGVYGVHKLHCLSDEEVLTIEHSALNRTVFARGALTAAGWLGGKPKGVYSMDDVIRL